METPFKNDIFSLIWQAFHNLYPDKQCDCYWEPEIRKAENGAEAFGLTDFGEDGTVAVFVTPTIPVCDCAEILAHELAHVAVGVEHNHDSAWEDAFDSIFREYNRIADELFGNKTTVTVTDGKAYVADNDNQKQ